MCIGLVPKNPWRKARKKPVIISFREPIPETLVNGIPVEEIGTKERKLFVICEKEYVAKGTQGELYPIDKKIFAETYEILETKCEACPIGPPMKGIVRGACVGCARKEIDREV